MNDQFDELTKSMAQSITRRGALKQFGVGLAGAALAFLGLASKASATPRPGGPGDRCDYNRPCSTGLICCPTSVHHLNATYCVASISQCALGYSFKRHLRFSDFSGTPLCKTET